MLFTFFYWIIQISAAGNEDDDPFNCGFNGYCYPSNRTSDGCNQCVCPKGTTQVSSNQCEVSTSCDPFPCLYKNQKCDIINGLAECSCIDGYFGQRCNRSISNPCSFTPCLHNGNCRSSGSTYTCECFAGFYGQQCQYEGNPCDGFCKNGGTCEMIFDASQPHCICPFKYYDERCNQEKRTSFVQCYSSSDFGDDSSYHCVDNIDTPPQCNQQLLSYRNDHPNSTLIYAVLSGLTKRCCLLSTNPMESAEPYSSSSIDFALIPEKLSVSVLEPATDLCATMNCGELNDDGVCIQTSPTEAECKCRKGKTGIGCSENVPVDLCQDSICPNECQPTDDRIGSYCSCPYRNSTKKCEKNVCKPTTCFNGGTCHERGNGNFSCACYNLYTNSRCKDFNPCFDEKCENNGECIPKFNRLDSTFECNCGFGYRGVYCQYKDECALNSTICTSVDVLATCNNFEVEEGFSCNCSEKYMSKYCHINKMVYEILNGTYGGLTEEQLEKMTIELTNDPTLVRDIVPFLIGTYDSETRKNLSWTSEDLFLWVAYEEQLIDINQNFYQWNDKVLGNCYTFNHHNSTFKYKARNPGFSGGLEMQINVKQNEYLPWIETSSIMIFTSKKGEAVTSESIRVTSTPGYESRVTINRKDYIRLGGKYGKCINDLTEIEHYYYEGNYTTDGCIRTCYQDVINDECGCMDPRYPMPPSALSCKITKKSCLDDLITARGDPGQWDECNCPIPCTQTVYESKLSRLPFTQNITQCKNFKNGTEECYKAYADMVWLQIGMPSLRYLVYQESKFMDFSKLLSNVGGLLSILIGISIVSFVELFILMLNIMFIIISNRKI